ncbi:hypothetical protein CPG37_04495 [Malaciobacter canalis]|uniref:Uncharacterized protein n=1 Tax=Malaciobacter canalis TaxID=1912871 RepID=A0ABX4LVQ1_9BACT|nr:hypothetical protein [Malaciobacter canalis]PHO10311.1 hypothetical protein CPG37_04495 [Malaciobacter canalis]QEE32416.1 hypothetical protein ACAN_0927 [Malaciobacter canalis]
MKHILKQLNQKPIAYYPVYREITGSTTAGILLSQLMYWFSKKDKIFKTDKEIQEETLLSEKELRNAKKLIKKLDFITVSREGLPAKTFYEIDWEKMYSSLAQWSKLEKPKGQNTTSQKDKTLHDQRAKHSIYTENTTENTTESITPSSIISFYRTNISSKNQDIQEPSSFNQINLRKDEFEKIMLGLKNYAKYISSTGKKPEALFFFVRNSIYLDYQEEQVAVKGKNEAIVPVDLVGKRFIVDGEDIEFKEDGYLKIEKDWKVTNAADVEKLVNLVRGA